MAGGGGASGGVSGGRRRQRRRTDETGDTQSADPSVSSDELLEMDAGAVAGSGSLRRRRNKQRSQWGSGRDDEQLFRGTTGDPHAMAAQSLAAASPLHAAQPLVSPQWGSPRAALAAQEAGTTFRNAAADAYSPYAVFTANMDPALLGGAPRVVHDPPPIPPDAPAHLWQATTRPHAYAAPAPPPLDVTLEAAYRRREDEQAARRRRRRKRAAAEQIERSTQRLASTGDLLSPEASRENLHADSNSTAERDFPHGGESTDSLHLRRKSRRMSTVSAISEAISREPSQVIDGLDVSVDIGAETAPARATATNLWSTPDDELEPQLTPDRPRDDPPASAGELPGTRMPPRLLPPIDDESDPGDGWRERSCSDVEDSSAHDLVSGRDSPTRALQL
ncbi:uncharacterized protein AMSG_02600 [Thecamonas trahens ATCC 50062]|uniref:Uncharacterized protein n=1 Tax=Thecamonas trahens ATCC 50062 TaxID=461836 RepID=A0A0L0D5G7_THETB|nr:hypothetical protein AMSG_02600 [Thecamonas trahens ATCC 50062]KNC47574.1 hypothetical protein AMSG_02600 [Thecamonas trahens ATCC 50062]|eukprot:XP_013759506.1 hypothetical protein AMSG_02600 [Thecamonas trahens ATCC 50062]